MQSTSIDLKLLEAFAAVMQSGSVTGAALILGKSQPVVTRLLQELEDELGFQLLARNGRGVTVTPRGAAFYKDVESALGSMRHLRERARELAGEELRAISIAATPSLAASIVPAALARLDRDGLLPRNILLRSQLAEDVIQAVAGRVADIGIASLPLDNPGIDVHWIAEASCVCVMSADDPMVRQDVVSIGNLGQRRLVTMSDPGRVLGRISAALQQAGIVPRDMISTNTSVTAMCAVRAGLGVAVVEPVTAYSLPLDGIAVRPLDVSIPYFWGIITPVGLPASPVVAPMIRALAEAASTRLPGFRVREAHDREAIVRELFGPGAGGVPA